MSCRSQIIIAINTPKKAIHYLCMYRTHPIIDYSLTKGGAGTKRCRLRQLLTTLPALDNANRHIPYRRTPCTVSLDGTTIRSMHSLQFPHGQEDKQDHPCPDPLHAPKARHSFPYKDRGRQDRDRHPRHPSWHPEEGRPHLP